MGAMIALGMAVEKPVAHQTPCSPQWRSQAQDAEASRAVCERAAQIRCGNMNIQQPLDRWFTDMVSDQTARVWTERMLAGVEPKAYATAYDAFARGDGTYAHRISEIKCPALFLTG